MLGSLSAFPDIGNKTVNIPKAVLSIYGYGCGGVAFVKSQTSHRGNNFLKYTLEPISVVTQLAERKLAKTV